MIPLPVQAEGGGPDPPRRAPPGRPGRLLEQVQRAQREGRGVRHPGLASARRSRRASRCERRFEDPEYAFVEKCFYPWKSFRINPYGDVYSCSIDVDFGNVREQPFSAIWNNDAYQTFRRTLKERQLFPKCAKCCALNNEFWRYLPTP